MSNIKYPHIKVKLTGEDGNAFFIIGRVQKAMKRANLTQTEVDAFITEATSGSYDHLLQTVMKTVETA